MNYAPEQARELVAQALESGDHIQGLSCLEDKRTNGMTYRCCLGVATRVYMEHEDNSITYSRGMGRTIFCESQGKEICDVSLLPEVMEWLDFRTEDGDYGFESLVNENDRGVSFIDIAKLFRNPPRELLV